MQLELERAERNTLLLRFLHSHFVRTRRFLPIDLDTLRDLPGSYKIESRPFVAFWPQYHKFFFNLYQSESRCVASVALHAYDGTWRE